MNRLHSKKKKKKKKKEREKEKKKEEGQTIKGEYRKRIINRAKRGGEEGGLPVCVIVGWEKAKKS